MENFLNHGTADTRASPQADRLRNRSYANRDRPIAAEVGHSAG